MKKKKVTDYDKLTVHYCKTVTYRKSACGLEFITPRTTDVTKVKCERCKRTKVFKKAVKELDDDK